MTSWTKKQNAQHKDLRTPKYKMRVAPLVRNEKREKALAELAKNELEDYKYGDTGGAKVKDS